MTDRSWLYPLHLQRLEAACLRLVTDPNYNRLIVEMPVRHGKSEFCSKLFPAWFLMLFPERNCILATHGADFSAEFGYKIRSLIRDYGPRLTGVRLDPDFRSRDHFRLAPPHTGQLRTASPGSSIAGRGAHLLIGDDLVKDQQEAASPARRESLWRWFQGEALTRLEPGGKVLLVMSRRHPDDLTGRCLAMNPDLPPDQQWHTIRFPALSETGEALWPERYSVERLEQIRMGMELAGTSYLWECLYQQNPTGDSTLTEWPADLFDGIVSDPDVSSARHLRILAIDPSKGSNARRGDYQALSDITLDPHGHLWVIPTLLRCTTDALEDTVLRMCHQTRYDGVIIEGNGFQEIIATNILKKSETDGILIPLHVKTSTENKVVRIRLALTPLLTQRRIHLLGYGNHVTLALGQLREFPSAAHDDFPDSLSLGTDLINSILYGG